MHAVEHRQRIIGNNHIRPEVFQGIERILGETRLEIYFNPSLSSSHFMSSTSCAWSSKNRIFKVRGGVVIIWFIQKL